jgi:hypothetical protein
VLDRQPLSCICSPVVDSTAVHLGKKQMRLLIYLRWSSSR